MRVSTFGWRNAGPGTNAFGIGVNREEQRWIIMTSKVTKLSNKALERLAADIETEQRRRAIKKLLAQDCQCDRYTCQACVGLQNLGYIVGEELGWS